LETYTEPKALLENPHFLQQKRVSLARLSDGMIDAPIVALINAFNRLPYGFTLQCCYGHFLYAGQRDSHNLQPLPITEKITRVEYRIAYVAFCIENSARGRQLLEALKGLTALDPGYLQFCCAEWFWERQVNSYALQVEPERYKHLDRTLLEYKEALHIEATRNAFFPELEDLLHEQGDYASR
jgi:hypothetical protein